MRANGRSVQLNLHPLELTPAMLPVASDDGLVLTVLETHRPQVLLEGVCAVSLPDALETLPPSDEFVSKVPSRVPIRREATHDGRIVKRCAEDGRVQMREGCERESLGQVFGREHCRAERGNRG
jgi:hypothetical protein